MKVPRCLLAVFLVGCQTVGTRTEKPQPLRLIGESRASLDGRDSKLEYRWNLGTRPFRDVECGGLTLSGERESRSPTDSNLIARFEALSSKRIKVILELGTTFDRGSSTTAVSTEMAIPGGLASIDRLTPAEPGTKAGLVALLRWKGSGSQPTALVVSFR